VIGGSPRKGRRRGKGGKKTPVVFDQQGCMMGIGGRRTELEGGKKKKTVSY